MHDAIEAERLGIPTVVIITDRFVPTARAVSAVNGLRDYPFSVIPHPIANNDDATLRANREGYSHYQLRPRRLRDATKVDMRVDLFGTTYNSPIFLCPTGAERSFFQDGELAVARAAKARGTLQCLSTSTSVPIEEVNAALGRPAWFQLYAPGEWNATERLLRRA